MKKKTLIFHIGCNAGFFSEYLEMVAAIAYCQINDVDFKLYSADANFGYKKGWNDFFDPFCSEVADRFHSSYNMRTRFPPLWRMLYKKFFKKQQIPKWYWAKYSWWYLKLKLIRPYYKFVYKFDYYTDDLWSKIQKCKIQNSIEYQKAHYDALCKTWHLNAETYAEIDKISETICLPEKYIGMQIRAGDKSEEQAVFDYEEYMNRVKSLYTEIHNLFILTDDYSIINKIRINFPEYKIFTLCKEDERGYDNEKFQKLDIDTKKKALMNLLASVEILWKSDILVGAINANPSLFLFLRRHPNAHWLNIR